MTILVVVHDDSMRPYFDAPLSQKNVHYADTITDALQRLPACRALIFARPFDQLGEEFLRTVYENDEKLPVVVVTLKPDLAEAVSVLRGRATALATDYLDANCDTFAEDLVAALTSPDRLERRGLEVRTSEKLAYYYNDPLPLTPTEVNLLSIFMRNPGVALDYTALSVAAYGKRLPEEEAKAKLKTHLWSLRKKTREAVGRDVIINRAGYGFVLVI